jgi:protein-disulfide isomerase
MLKRLIVCFFLVALAAAQTTSKAATKPAGKTSVATGSAEKTALPSEEAVNSFLYQTFGYDPSLTWKVSEIRPSQIPGLAEVTFTVSSPRGPSVESIYVSSDGKHAIAGEVMPFGAHPYEDAKVKLEKGVNGPARGPAKAPVLIVEFSDLQCPHCKEAAPVLDQLLAQEPDVRFVFQNFPLPSHNWAEKAAQYADCVSRASNDAFWKFVQKTFDQQSNITESNADEKLKAIATDSGVNADEIAACAAKPETQGRIEASVALGKSVGVNGTPAIFINGRPLSGGVPVEVLKKVVDFQAAQQKKQESAKAN